MFSKWIDSGKTEAPVLAVSSEGELMKARTRIQEQEAELVVLRAKLRQASGE